MSKVTVFKNIMDVYDPHVVDVITVFRRIREGKNKGLIDSIRLEKDKEKRNELKKRLPSICFSGKFSQRGEKYLIEHSGLICLDIDDVRPNDMPHVRSVLEDDPYTMACFVSPSGNGYKVIIKIISDKSEHKGSFMALEKHFNNLLVKYKIDPSGKDISRVCYESFDERIYQNPDSDVWEEVLEEKNIKIPLEDQQMSCKLLKVWIDKQETYVEGNRNNYLSKFLYASCRAGIDEYTAKRFLSDHFPNCPQKDLDSMGKSCYEKEEFGSFQFTKQDFETFKKSKGKAKIEIKTNESIVDFWHINDKGRVKIDTKRFLEFVEGQNFGIYRYPDSIKTWEFVRKQNMIVDVVDIIDIKKVVMEHVKKHAPEPVYDELQMKNRFFEKTFLNSLPEIKIEQVRDTNDKCYIFFEKYYYEITKNKKEKKDYLDLEGIHIWRKQVCEKEINKLYSFEDYKDFDFSKFVFNAMGKDPQKFKAACTTLGYSIHNYKKQSLAKLIYACDNSISELDGMAMGGSGKNLFQQCLEYVRSVEYIDGKDFDKKDKYKFQNVGVDTQLVIIDDYEGDITEMFTKITGHFAIEKKFMDKMTLPFSISPKMLLSSNRSPKGYSDSYARRLQLLEFSNHYNYNFTPNDEFDDREFFGDNWIQKDWDMLFSFLFDCIMMYLNEGLIKTESGDLKTKQLIMNTKREFFEFWAYSCDKDMTQFNNGRWMLDKYKEVMGDVDMTAQAFYGMCRKMCKLYGWEYCDKGVGVTKEIKFIGFKSIRK